MKNLKSSYASGPTMPSLHKIFYFIVSTTVSIFSPPSCRSLQVGNIMFYCLRSIAVIASEFVISILLASVAAVSILVWQKSLS